MLTGVDDILIKFSVSLYVSLSSHEFGLGCHRIPKFGKKTLGKSFMFVF